MNILSVISGLCGSVNEPTLVKTLCLKVLLNKTDIWEKEVRKDAQFFP